MTSSGSPKVALVTGGSRGIGAACGRRLAADGMAVAINSHPDEQMRAAAESVAEEIRRSGGSAAVFTADITDRDVVDVMFDACEEQLGPVYALVLNAATRVRRRWAEVTENDWDTISAVNLKGAFLCARRAFGRDDQANDGVVVTISSVQAKIGAIDNLPYVTTKAGIIGFTRSLARELGPRGIRVNCVMPGAIQTEGELEAFPDQDEVKRTVFGLQALQRRGRPDDVAAMVSFLTGPESTFITGQTICVDGGWVLT